MVAWNNVYTYTYKILYLLETPINSVEKWNFMKMNKVPEALSPLPTKVSPWIWIFQLLGIHTHINCQPFPSPHIAYRTPESYLARYHGTQ
jgi:hypothetical protein